MAVILMSLLGGCAASHPDGRTAVTPRYQDSPASALAFTPAVALGEPGVDLPRDVRQPGAFVGYEDTLTTFFYLQTDDQIGDNGCNWFSRRAVSERVGVSYR